LTYKFDRPASGGVTEKVGKYPSRIFYTKKGNDFDAIAIGTYGLSIS